MRESSMSEIVERLGRALKRKRESLSLSLADLGNDIGVSASTLSRVERHVKTPHANTIAILANWLGIPAERIFREDLSSRVSLNKPLPVIISEHLARDENLTTEGKEFLTKFFQTTYAQMVEVEEGRRNAC